MEKRNSATAPAGKYILIGAIITGFVIFTAVAYILTGTNPVSDLYGSYPDAT